MAHGNGGEVKIPAGKRLFSLRHTSRGAVRHLPVAALLALAACSSGVTSGPGAVTGPAAQSVSGAKNVGILLPLTGANGVLGNEMLTAAKLALAQQKGASPAPVVDAHDTAGAGGVTAAMQAAIAAGDGIVLGPLTSSDTALLAPQAIQSGVPVVAFTSDIAQARPGVWVFGITPYQQVARLVSAARAEGRTRFAAFLPNTPLGRALGDGLIRACQETGLTPPSVAYHENTPEAIRAGLATLSAYDTRTASVSTPDSPSIASPAASSAASPVGATDSSGAPPLPADLAAALSTASRASAAADAHSPNDPKAVIPPAVRQATQNGEAASLSPPPFDALLLGDTGLGLKDVIDALKADQVNTAQVRIMGPGLWSAFAGKLAGLAGAWYAAPDPGGRTGFVQRFTAQNHRLPKPLADLAYDAGNMAGTVHAASGGNGYPVDLLTRVDGFAGVDGAFTLTSDGNTLRNLGIFEIQRGGGAHPVSIQATKAPGAS